MNVIEKIQENYHTLSRTQRRIADFLLQSSDKACFLSLKELSEEVSASKVTIIRFARMIGFENYTVLKSELQRYVSNGISPSEKIASAIENLGQNGVSQIIRQDKENIEQTLMLLSDISLRAALTLIKQSKRIFMVGDNISKIVADFMRLRLRDLRLDVANFDLSSLTTISSQLQHTHKDDIFIIISFPKYADNIVPLAEYLRENDYKVICLTDRLASPVGRNASVAFACSTESSVFYNSITAPIALANIIVSALAIELSDDYKERCQSINETVRYLKQKSESHHVGGRNRETLIR